jgi:hypothetical protein
MTEFIIGFIIGFIVFTPIANRIVLKIKKMKEEHWFKNKSMIFRHWICKKFGHSFRPIDLIIFNIKTNEINRDMNATITCRCCKEEFVHKDAYRTNI